MNQFIVDVYAIVNVLFLCWYIFNKGLKLSPGVIILAFYVLIAVLGIPAYEMLKTDQFFYKFDFSNITVLPYVFYFIASLALIKPIFGMEQSVDNAHIAISYKKVVFFIYLYIVCAFVSGYLYYKTITTSGMLLDMASARMDVYNGEQINAYSNSFERFFLSFAAHMNIPATIIFFLALSRFRKYFNKFLLFLLGIAVIIPPFGDAVRTVSRGMVITLIIQLVLAYSFFSKDISKKLKKIFVIALSILLVGVLAYSIFVTNERFGEGADSNSSLICYWGQPPIIFNSQVVTINEYAYGARFFYPIADFFGLDTRILDVLANHHWGPCFTTLIGDIWIDYSIFGVVLVCIFVPRFINRFKLKKHMSIPDIYVLVYYCLLIQHGALVTGYGLCQSVGFAILFYFVLKYMTQPLSGDKKMVS